MSLLGIDVGTSGCKAAVFSEDGRMLGLAYQEYDYEHAQPGWAELDTPRVWQKIQRTIREAAAGAGGDPVKALCVSSLGEAVVPVSAGREILGPSLLNFDVRGSDYFDGRSSPDQTMRLYRINGNTPGPNYSLNKLVWIRQNQPDLYRRTHAFLHWSGFVSFMLGAEARVDYSLANRTLLFDLQRCDWSDELLAESGLERDRLPLTVPSGVVIGELARGMASDLGLPPGIPIVSGGHDQCCNGVGCGVITPGSAMYGMGTFFCMMPVFDHRLEAPAMIERGLNTEHHAAPGQFVSFIYNQGGSLLKWYRDTFAVAERRQAAEGGLDLYPDLIAEAPPGPGR